MSVCSNSFIVIGFNVDDLFNNLDEAILFSKKNNFNIFSLSIKKDLFEHKIIGLKHEEKEITLNQNIFTLDVYKQLSGIKNVNIGLYSVDTTNF